MQQPGSRAPEWDDVLRALNLAVLVVDRELRITRASPAAEAAFGAATGDPTPRLDDPALVDDVRRVLAGESCAEREDRGGDGRWYRTRVAPCFDERGRVAGATLIRSDATARRAGDEARRATEARLRALVDQVKDYAIFSTDPQGVVTSWNEGCRRVLGYEREEFLGMDARRLFTPEDLAAGVAEWELRLAASEGTAENDRWMVAKNGRRFYASGVTTGLRDEAGQLLGFSKVLRDHTDWKAAQERLRESEERLRLAVQGGNLGTWRVDLDTMTDTRDAGLNAILGLDPVETAQPNEEFFRRVHPEDRAAAREAWRAAVEEGGVYDVEMRVVRPDGEVRWVRDRGEVYRDPSGRPRFVTGVLIDVTQQKRHEEHLRFVMQELNHRVRNTLTVVQSTADQTLRNTRSPEEFREAFGERLRALAKAHLVLTRTEWRGATLRDLVMAELKPRLDHPEQLEVEGPPLTLRPNAALALHMALHELATNAVKYGALSEPKGRVRLTWDLERTPRGAEAVVRWTETGGPSVTPPEERGFGTRMLVRTVSFELQGEADLKFPRDGVRCTMRFPWSKRVGEANRAPEREGSEAPSVPPDL